MSGASPKFRLEPFGEIVHGRAEQDACGKNETDQDRQGAGDRRKDTLDRAKALFGQHRVFAGCVVKTLVPACAALNENQGEDENQHDARYLCGPGETRALQPCRINAHR